MVKDMYEAADAGTDFRKHPEKYRVGRGEQGVLTVEPYKRELLPHWRFKTPEIAAASAQKLLELFYGYLDAGDFVGADMARKFLQMGWTRARRYANHRGGKKYGGSVPADKKGQSGAHGRPALPRHADPIKARAAEIFYARYREARENERYQAMKRAHQEKYG